MTNDQIADFGDQTWASRFVLHMSPAHILIDRFPKSAHDFLFPFLYNSLVEVTFGELFFL